MSVFALVKLKKGTEASVDRHYETFDNDNDIWLAEKRKGSRWNCRKDGYGVTTNYGGGCAYILSSKLELLTPMALRESKLFDEYQHLFFT